MASTVFTDASATAPGTVIVSSWLNDVNTGTYNALSAVAGTNTITATGPLTLTAYAVGQRFTFIPAATNTGAVTLNINGLGAKAVTTSGAVALLSGQLVVAAEAMVVYDGTQFQLLNPLGFYSTQFTSSGRNIVQNGEFMIDQRGTGTSGITTSGYFTDRWNANQSGGSLLYSRFATTGLVPHVYAGRIASTANNATAAGDFRLIQQTVEGFNIGRLQWGTASARAVTLSFWARSSLTGNFAVAIRNGGSNRSYVASFTISSTNTWEQKSITIPGDTTGTWAVDTTAGLNVSFSGGAGTTFQTTTGVWTAGNFLSFSGAVNVSSTNGATLDVTGVQIEVGTYATPFERKNFNEYLIECQRYYYASYEYGVLAGTVVSSNGTWRAVGSDVNNATVMYPMYPVNMRIGVNTVIYNPATGTQSAFRNTGSGASVGLSTAVVGNTRGVYVLNSTAGITVGNTYEFHMTANADF